MSDDDKPAPIHYGTIATACGIVSRGTLSGTNNIDEVTCTGCLFSEEKRKKAVADSWKWKSPRPDEADIVTVTIPARDDKPAIEALRADLIEALTPELGPKMARAAVMGPEVEARPDLKALKAHVATMEPDGWQLVSITTPPGQAVEVEKAAEVQYGDTEQAEAVRTAFSPERIGARIAAEAFDTMTGRLIRGEIVEPEPGLSVGYAFPPGEPLPAGRYEVPREQSHEAEVGEVFIDREEIRKLTLDAPWRWELTDKVGGSAGVLEDASGRTVIRSADNGQGFMRVAPSDAVLIAAAPEMEALLRIAAYETQPNGVCGDIHETGTFRADMLALLARLDAAKART